MFEKYPDRVAAVKWAWSVGGGKRLVGGDWIFTDEQLDRLRFDYDALAARLAEAIAWIEYAHRSDCRTVPDHNGDAYWSCDCGRDELVKNLRAAVSEEPAP